MQSLLERYEEEDGAASDGPLRFRGILLDKDSFAVDVEEWGLPDERVAIRETQCAGGERG